jgi:hypothetical protein
MVIHRKPSPNVAFVDADDLPAEFVRALYAFGPEVTVWSRPDALATRNNLPGKSQFVENPQPEVDVPRVIHRVSRWGQ